MEKICQYCKWWTRGQPRGLCHLNPVVVETYMDDYCSHWTPKALNEDKKI